MITLFFLLPFALTLLGLVVLPFLVAHAWRKAEAPYQPDMGDPEAWRAELEVALGEGWFEAAPKAPKATRKRVPTPRRGQPTPSTWVVVRRARATWDHIGAYV